MKTPPPTFPSPSHASPAEGSKEAAQPSQVSRKRAGSECLDATHHLSKKSREISIAAGKYPEPRTRLASADLVALAAATAAALATAGAPHAPGPGRTPRIHFDVTPRTDTQFAIPAAFRADFLAIKTGLPWFPADLCDVDVIADSALFKEGRSKGSMEVLEPEEPGGKTKILLSIGIDPSHVDLTVDAPASNAAIALALYKFASLLAANALGTAIQRSEGGEPLPPSLQNMKKFRPSTEANGFHRAIKSMGNHVRQPLKVPWLQHYANDVGDACGLDYFGDMEVASLGSEIARWDDKVHTKGLDWQETLAEAADPLEPEFWQAPDVSRVRAGSESSAREDGASVAGGSNPMRLTPLDREEIDQIEIILAARLADSDD